MSRTVPVISAMWPAGWATPTSTSRWRTSRAIPGWSLASTTSKPPEARCRGRAAPTTAALPRLPGSAGGPRRPAGVHVGVECGRALRVLVVLLPPDLALDPGERQSCVRANMVSAGSCRPSLSVAMLRRIIQHTAVLYMRVSLGKCVPVRWSCGLLSADELQVPAERSVGRSLVAGGDEVEQQAADDGQPKAGERRIVRCFGVEPRGHGAREQPVERRLAVGAARVTLEEEAFEWAQGRIAERRPEPLRHVRR